MAERHDSGLSESNISALPLHRAFCGFFKLLAPELFFKILAHTVCKM